MNQYKYFLLFANCIPVKGAARSIVCDLQSGTYIFVPNELFVVLENRRMSIDELAKKIWTDTQIKLESYLDNIAALNFGHYTNSPELFPSISTAYSSPYDIHDSIIELSEFTYENFNAIAVALENLGASCVEFRAYNEFDLERISKMITLLETTRVRSVEIYLKYSDTKKLDDYISFVKAHKLIGVFVVHGSFTQSRTEVDGAIILFLKDEMSSSNCCGNISEQLFNINLRFYLESKQFNTCLYKKLTINTMGDIMNCPSMTESFGNIKDVNITEVIRSKKFQHLGKISKDQISVCRDCEFRYICSDCRGFVGETEKPLKCKYDPYSATYS